jgi:hypothetical protein
MRVLGGLSETGTDNRPWQALMRMWFLGGIHHYGSHLNKFILKKSGYHI